MGQAIIFMVSLAGDAIFGGFFVLYASHHFLTVLADSSGGIDEVRWPEDETVFDWPLKGAYCVWVLGFWLLTATLTLAPFVVWNLASYVVFVAVVVWLMHPVGTLSTLSTRNWLFQVWPPLLLQMGRHGGALLLAYAVTLPALAVTAGLLYATFFRSFGFIIPAAVCLAGTILFYARVWGQVAWLVMNWERKEKRAADEAPAARALSVDDPWTGPPPEDDIPELDVEEIIDDPHGKRPPPVEEEEEETEWTLNKKPYGLAEEDVDDATAGPPRPNRAKPLSEHLDADHRREKRRKRRTERLTPTYDRRPPTFERAMGRRLFRFLFYPATMHAWLTLTLAALLALAMLFVTVSFFPEV